VPFVLTVDQLESRTTGDAVDHALGLLSEVGTILPFTRTVGDEFQGLLDGAASAVDAILLLMRHERWHIGLGLGAVEQPLPTDSRAARGPAFLCARTAVEAAKTDVSHLAVVAAHETDHEAEDVQAVWRLTAALRRRRSPSGWAAVDLMLAGHTRSEAARRLGVSRQAVGQRLQAAHWDLEAAIRPTLTRLLTRADEAASA
jgi:hypothetical protein